MKSICTKLLFISLLCFAAAAHCYGQQKDPKYTIELKLLRSHISLTEDTSNLIFTVTVVNHTGNHEDFGTVIHYGYKKFHTHDFYMEAVDMDNNHVDIDGDEDMEFAYDPLDENVKHYDKISEKINTSAYQFSPGKYKLRWVYDPSGNRTTPVNENTKMPPVYSNWQLLTVTE